MHKPFAEARNGNTAKIKYIFFVRSPLWFPFQTLLNRGLCEEVMEESDEMDGPKKQSVVFVVAFQPSLYSWNFSLQRREIRHHSHVLRFISFHSRTIFDAYMD